MTCSLSYIPDNLHWNNRPIQILFKVGDLLFRRCKIEELENPFAKISICDVSVNSNRIEEFNFQETDVLFNTLESLNFEKHELEICTLEIKDLNEQQQYDKKFNQVKNEINREIQLKLVHAPNVCMYPHCAFKIFENGIEIKNFEEYKSKGIDKLKSITGDIRHELAKMIIQREVWQNESV